MKRDDFHCYGQRQCSWSVEYVAGQNDGLQDRKECLCEEMDHTHLLCLLWKVKIPAKMSAPDEALVLETRGKWKRSYSQTERMQLEMPNEISLFTLHAWWLESRREVWRQRPNRENWKYMEELFMSCPLWGKSICGQLAPTVVLLVTGLLAILNLPGTQVLDLYTSVVTSCCFLTHIFFKWSPLMTELEWKVP